MFRMCIACSIIEKMTKDKKNAHSTLLGHSTVYIIYNRYNTQSAAVAHVPHTHSYRRSHIHSYQYETYQCQAYLPDTYSYHSAPQSQ